MSQLLEMKNITKVFPGVKALDNVHFDLREGETHILLGENGAGKSTLIKVLSGAYKQNGGEIFIDGKPVQIKTPSDSFGYGINVIYQEFQLAPHLSIYENVFLGRELTGKFNFINKKKIWKKTQEVMEFVGLDAFPDDLIKDLTVAQKQLVEIIKALVFDARIIVFDEPTATLTDNEAERLFEIIHQLEEEGLGLVYISHRLEEFEEVGKRCTVLRNGEYVDTVGLDKTGKNELISMMIGGEINQDYRRESISCSADQVFWVEGISYSDKVKDVSFDLCKQEVLGIAGLVGAGRTELAKTLIGEYKADSGEIYLQGKKIKLKSPHDAIKGGIIYLSEDRKDEGLFLGHSVRRNITISSLDKITENLLLQDKCERNICSELVDKLNIKTPNLETETLSLSGGNQQKVVIAKALCREPSIYIFDEPTRGIDVGAKEEIYKIMESLVKNGASIIMISSEIPELMRITDRIMVMAHGQVTGIYNNDSNLSKQKILAAAVEEVE